MNDATRDEDKPRRRPADGSIEQRPRPGATRCPFCHEPCEADAESCACAECLSRHHRACWTEGAACASCGATRRLEPAERAAEDAHGLGATVEAWLRLGLAYDGALVLVTLAASALRLLALRGSLPSVIDLALGAVLANMCFLLGPAIELAARRLGYRGAWLHWLLFVPGLLLAMLLATGCVLLA